MSYTDDAERTLIIEWPLDDGIAKIFTVDRDGLDEGDNEPDAYELIFIDGGGVRRHETLIDASYGRFDGMEDGDIELLATCPDSDVIGTLKDYCGEW